MIIYTYPVPTAFTERDVEMLRPHHKVKTLLFTNNALRLPFYFILQFLQLVILLPKTKYYLCFFGGYHSVLPTLFGKVFQKKTFIQCGGTDAMNMPEINYGNFRKKWLKKATVYSFKNCTKILPVAEALVRQEYIYDSSINSKQGLLNLIPDLKTPIQVIHNGFDATYWRDQHIARTPFSFTTVAMGISKKNRAAVKGIDLILEMAKQYPHYQFTLVGDPQFNCPLPNVKIIGKLTPDGLRNLFNQHQFYLQLSISEGFPNALAEAMLCGCVPIGSAVGAIPEIIGKTGFILYQKNPKKLNKLFLELPNYDLDQLRKEAAFRIQENFGYQKRQQFLLSLFDPTHHAEK
jgi:glycosyltransferase involved in cell wall biosynthesis